MSPLKYEDTFKPHLFILQDQQNLNTLIFFSETTRQVKFWEQLCVKFHREVQEPLKERKSTRCTGLSFLSTHAMSYAHKTAGMHQQWALRTYQKNLDRLCSPNSSPEGQWAHRVLLLCFWRPWTAAVVLAAACLPLLALWLSFWRASVIRAVESFCLLQDPTEQESEKPLLSCKHDQSSATMYCTPDSENTSSLCRFALFGKRMEMRWNDWNSDVKTVWGGRHIRRAGVHHGCGMGAR